MAQQIIIRVEDSTVLPSLRKILGLIKGVSIVKCSKVKKEDSSQQLLAYEQSVDDIQNGRVNTYKNAADFFEKMGIE